MKPFTICVATAEHLGYAKDVSEALADAAKASGTGLAILLFALPQVEIQEGLMDKPLYQSSFCVEEVNAPSARRWPRERSASKDPCTIHTKDRLAISVTSRSPSDSERLFPPSRTNRRRG